MTKTLALLALLLPLTALAQGAGPAPGPRGPGPGTDERIEKMEKRARLARNLGLAEALDLDTAQTARLADALAKNDERRIALHKQLRDARMLLRRAADGEKATAAEVDGALAKILDLRAQAVTLDRETIAIVTRDLSPEKKARAALFLGRFEQRMGGGPGMGHGRGGGMGGRGPGMHRGEGPGMGRGGMGRGRGECSNCPWDDDAD